MYSKATNATILLCLMQNNFAGQDLDYLALLLLYGSVTWPRIDSCYKKLIFYTCYKFMMISRVHSWEFNTIKCLPS